MNIRTYKNKKREELIKALRGLKSEEGVVLTQGHLIKFSGAIASVVSTPGFTPYITVKAHIVKARKWECDS